MDYLTKLNDLKYRNLKIKGSLKTRIDLQKVLTKEIEENMINSKQKDTLIDLSNNIKDNEST